MYLFKNAMKNLMRNKGRNIIIATIMLAMLSFTAVSMIIRSATSRVIHDYKTQFGSEIYLQYDETKIEEEQKNGGFADIPEISDNVKLAISESDYLKETKIEVQYPSFAKELKGLTEGKTQNETGNIDAAPSGGETYYEPNVTVRGFNTPDLLEDFKEGKRKITSGRMFEKDGECVVSEDFAKLNNLKIGDTVSVSDCVKDAKFSPLTLKITGIYFDSTKSQFGYASAATNPRNDILTTYNTMKTYEEAAKTRLYTINATYYLKNPDLLAAFDKEAHEKGLHRNYKMSTDEMSYNQIVKPAESLAGVSTMFLIVVLIVGSVVLVLLSVLAIRERKYEIGVLRAMGMKKMKVVRGLLYESLVTIGVCLVIGLSIGALAAGPVSDGIIAGQQSAGQSQFGGAAQVEPKEIKVSLTPQAALGVSGIALLLAVLSSSAGVLAILRYEPMKILSERN